MILFWLDRISYLVILISDMNSTYKIRALGGTLVVTLPQQVARILSLKAGDDVSISVVSIGAGGEVLIKPVRAKKPGPKRNGGKR